MTNRVLEQVKTVKSMDAEVSKQYNDRKAHVADLTSKRTQIEKDDFIKECPRLIHKAFQSCEADVTKVCNLQAQILLEERYCLKNYLTSYSAEKFSNAQFTAVFGKACGEFSRAMKKITELTDAQICSSAASDCYIAVSRAYATISAIDKRRDELVKEVLIPKFDTHLSAAKSEIEQAEKAKELYLQEAKKKLGVAVEELEKRLMEEEARLKACILRNDAQMESDFSKDYQLYIGKMLEEKAQDLSLSNISYRKRIEVGGPVGIRGYDPNHSSNILVDTAQNVEIADRFAENLIMKFITSYPTKFKKVVAMHNQSGSPLLRVMSRVVSCGTQAEFAFQKGISPVVNSEEEMETVLAQLDKRVNDVCSLLGISGDNDIYSYNEKHPDTAEPITLVVIRDFPSGFSRAHSLNLFQRVYEQGNKAGIIMAVLWDKSFVTDQYGDMPRALEYIKHAHAGANLITTAGGMLLDGVKDFSPLQRSSDFSDAVFFKNINEELKRQNKPIDLFDVQPKEDFASSPRRKEFSEHLIIPLGKFGGQTMSLKLSSVDKAHVVVNGGTGSGKTAFLHTLILSAAQNYAPDELEINLFDFKDGVGFKMYKEKRLPHVNFIALENKIEDAQDILTYINSLMTERNKLISSFDGVNSLKGYNERVATGKYPDKKKIPRCLIIIDEYQFLLMNDKCVSVLENIARQGRSAGMSLVLVSQDVPTNNSFTSIKQLLDHRFAFRGSTENVERLIAGTGKRAAELELQKGLCFYEANDGLVKTMRTAFAGDDVQLSQNIDKIVKKYPGKHRPLQIVGKPKPLFVEKLADMAMLPAAQLKRDYLDQGICHFVLGRYSITQEPVRYVANENNPLLAVVGNYLKSKQIITSLICGMLNVLKNVEDKAGKILFADLCEQRRLVNQPSPLSELIAKKCELEDEGEEAVLDALQCYDFKNFDDMIDRIYKLYEDRCYDNTASLDPVQVIVIGADSLNPVGRMADKLKEVLINGKKCDIYFTFQVDSLDCAFAKSILLQKNSVTLKDLILLSENESDYSNTSLEIRSALNALSGLVGGKVSSEYTKSLEKNPLHPANSFIIDDGNISKYTHFQFKTGWVNDLISELNK